MNAKERMVYDDGESMLDYVDRILDFAACNIHFRPGVKEWIQEDEVGHVGDTMGFAKLADMMVGSGLLQETIQEFYVDDKPVTGVTYTTTLKGLEWLEQHRARKALIKIAASIEGDDE